jgi:hypothetical protein
MDFHNYILKINDFSTHRNNYNILKSFILASLHINLI